MIEPAENPSRPPNNPEFERVMAQLRRMSAEEVVRNFNEARTDVDSVERELSTSENIDAVDLNKFPKQLKKDRKEDLKKISDVVTNLAFAIRYPGESDININVRNNSETLLAVAEKIVGRGNSRVNEENAIFIYRILEKGLAGELETFDGLKAAFDSISLLESVDELLHTQISFLFVNRAIELRIKDVSEINKLRTKKEKINPEELDKRNNLDILLSEEKQILNHITKKVDGIQLNLNGPEYEAAAKEQAEIHTGQNSGRDFENAKNSYYETHRDVIKTEINHQIMRIYNPRRKSIPPGTSKEEMKRIIWEETLDTSKITPTEIQQNYGAYMGTIGELYQSHSISQQEYLSLKSTGELALNNAIQILEVQGDIGDAGIFEASRHYVQGWTEAQDELLKAMRDPKAFKDYILQSKEYNNFNDPEADWEHFQNDIRGLFDQIFSAAKANPKDFWEKTFNELTEGMFYKQLLMGIRRIGLELEKDPIISKKIVKLRESLYEPEEDSVPKVTTIGGMKLARDKLTEKSLSYAIGNFLISEMIEHKEVTETLHNMTVISDLGMGFDKMAEYSGRVRYEDIIRIIKNIPGLSEAHQLYQRNVQMILALNGHNIPVSLGLKSKTRYDLDEAGWRSFLQLSANDEIKRLNYSKEKIANLVRTATGLSKGIFGGYWSSAMNSHNGFEFVIDSKKSDLANKKVFYKRVSSYTSTNDKGVERMLPSIDYFIIAERFDLLRNFQSMFFTYSARDLTKKISKEDYWYRHEDIEDYKTEIGEARGNGYSNRLGDFDENHKFMADSLRTASIDLAERAGWRHVDYMRYVIFKINPDGTPVQDQKTKKFIVDFDMTMKRLHGVGEAYIRSFIDDIFTIKRSFQEDVSDLDINNLGKDIIRRYESELKGKRNKKSKGGWTSAMPIDDDQKAYLKELFYKEFVLEPLLKQFPSDAVLMEDRRWMPRDEAIYGNNLRDTLTRFVLRKMEGSDLPEGFVENNYLPLYISAVQMMEQLKWNKELKNWEKNEETGKFNHRDPLDYEFVLTQQDVSENRDKLIDFYKEFKSGQSTENRVGRELELNTDLFLKELPEFFSEMKRCINADRWDRSKENGVQKGKKVTLSSRYAHYLAKEMANISTHLSWNHMNLNKANLHSSGTRVPERAWGEVALLLKDYTPELSSILLHKFPELISHKYANDKEFEKTVHELLAPSFKKMSAAIANIDTDQAYKHLAHLIVQLGVAGGKDRIKRIGVLGPLYEEIAKRANHQQSSFMTDNIPDSLREASSSLTSTQIEIMTVVLCEAVGIRRDKHFPKGYESPKLFGREVHGFLAKILPRKQIHDRATISTEDLVEAQGVELKSRIKESIPTFGLVLLIITAMLAKLAFDKDNKK